MKTIKDIIAIVYFADVCKKIDIDIPCDNCSSEKYCAVDTKIITLDYLWRGEYYG